MWQLRENARPILTDDGGAILDERTGNWTHLTPTASAAILLLAASTTEEEAVEQYAERYGIPARQANADVRMVAETLTARGLAATEPPPPPLSPSTEAMTSTKAYSTVPTGTFTERMAAAAGLLLALALLRLPFRHTTRTTRTIRRARQAGRRPLTPEQAEALAEAVRHTSRLWPGRATCMETSLGAVLAAALMGRRLNWCLGARFTPPPVEHHAWAELPGHGPIGEHTQAAWHHHTALTI